MGAQGRRGKIGERFRLLGNLVGLLTSETAGLSLTARPAGAPYGEASGGLRPQGWAGAHQVPPRALARPGQGNFQETHYTSLPLTHIVITTHYALLTLDLQNNYLIIERTVETSWFDRLEFVVDSSRSTRSSLQHSFRF